MASWQVYTDRVIERGRKVAAQVVDGGVDGGYSLVFLQILVCSLHQQLTQLACCITRHRLLKALTY